MWSSQLADFCTAPDTSHYRKYTVNRLSLLLTTALLTACFSLDIADWPEDLPSARPFVRAWQADTANQSLQPQDEYLYWVRAFYTGTTVYPRGWLSMQAELLSLVSPAERQQLAQDVESLGVAIGAEWAKENETRAIDNRLLALWGSVMQMSVVDDKQLEAVELIAADVEGLLDGSLRKEAIAEVRYADRLGYEVFGDF